jgi:TonB family protein
MVGLILLATISAAFNTPPTASRTSGDQGDFLSRHYPARALASGEEGQVGFSVDITAEGRIEQCRITQSSGYATLDRETCDFIVQYARFGAARDIEGKAYASTKNGLINWKLPAGVAKSTAARMSAASLPPPLFCRRAQKTGSTVASVTHCMTDSEWRQHEQLVRADLEATLTRRACSAHGC